MADNFKCESSKMISRGFCFNLQLDSNLEPVPCTQFEHCVPLQSSKTEIASTTTENPPITSSYGFIIGVTVAFLAVVALLGFCGYLVFSKYCRAHMRLQHIESNGTENWLSIMIENEIAGTSQNLIDLDWKWHF